MGVGIHLYCDGDMMCVNRYYKDRQAGAQTLRDGATHFGWRHVDGKDYCPMHRPPANVKVYAPTARPEATQPKAAAPKGGIL